MAKILIVDDEENVRKIIGIQLKRLKHDVVEAADGEEAWQKIQSEEFDTVVTDLKMPKMDGLELLQLVRRHRPQTPVIMITAHGTIDTAVEAMKRGAYDYVTKPFEHEEFVQSIERAVRSSQEMTKEFQRSRAFLRQEDKIIGSTQDLEKVYSVIESVCNQDSSILITGEAGTGKEVVVRLLHDKSHRKERPLVRAYLSSIAPSQHEAHLFGDGEKPGCFELAEDGSLYLDEVGALDLNLQAKLFETLTSGSYKKANRKIEIGCRIIAASDFNLLEKIEGGLFRKDLFYTLNVVPIYLPPLRERTQDIEPLADHFIKVFSKKFDKQISHLDEEALFYLIQYPWPGNIRELENCIEYAVNVVAQPVIRKEELPSYLFASPVAKQDDRALSFERDEMFARVQRLEKNAIEEALKSSGGDLLRASQKLGVPPSLLESRAMDFRIDFK